MTASVKRLIVNADDLGRTAGSTAASSRPTARGIVTSATLMVNYARGGRGAGAGAGEPAAWASACTSRSPAGRPRCRRSRSRAWWTPRAGCPPSRRASATRDADGGPGRGARPARGASASSMGRDPTHFDSHHHSHRDSGGAGGARARWPGRRACPCAARRPRVRERLRREGIRTTDRVRRGVLRRRRHRWRRWCAILDGLPAGHHAS